MTDIFGATHAPSPPAPASMDEYENFYLHARFITGLVFYPIICVFGIAGNAMGMVVMSKRQMKSSTNVYLFSLALIDLVKLGCDFLYFIVILLFQVAPASGNLAYGLLYPYAHYIFNASLCISAWLIVSVAIERYIYVRHPLKVKFYCNINRAKIISVSVYVIMAMLAIPYALRYKTIEKMNTESEQMEYDVSVTSLWKNNSFATAFTWFQNSMRSTIPLFILIVLNGCIVNGLRRCRLMRSKPPTKNKITRMLLAVIIVFLVCITPDTIMSTFFGLGYLEENYLARGIREITDLLLLVNSAVNFIIYCIFNSIFWNHFQRLFCSSCYRCTDNRTDARQFSMLYASRSVTNIRGRTKMNTCSL